LTFIPLLIQLGEAYHFDWSHEDVEIAGASVRVVESAAALKSSPQW
jgi:hypothetical protein